LDRAAERGAHADLDQGARPYRVACRADACDVGDDLVGCLAQVGEAVRMAGRERNQHEFGPAFDGALGAFEVGHQHRRFQPRQCLRELEHLSGVGELRQQTGRHEGADFDLALSGVVGIANPFDLLRRGQHPGDALQAVAQSDLANDGAAWE
jgi:hypothetical protein